LNAGSVISGELATDQSFNRGALLASTTTSKAVPTFIGQRHDLKLLTLQCLIDQYHHVADDDVALAVDGCDQVLFLAFAHYPLNRQYPR